MEIKVVKHRTTFHEGSQEDWKYFVTITHGNNWEWALLQQDEYDRGFEVVMNTMKSRVMNSPQTPDRLKKRVPWFDGLFVRTDGYPECAEGKVIYFSTSSV